MVQQLTLTPVPAPPSCPFVAAAVVDEVNTRTPPKRVCRLRPLVLLDLPLLLGLAPLLGLPLLLGLAPLLGLALLTGPLPLLPPLAGGAAEAELASISVAMAATAGIAARPANRRRARSAVIISAAPL